MRIGLDRRSRFSKQGPYSFEREPCCGGELMLAYSEKNGGARSRSGTFPPSCSQRLTAGPRELLGRSRESCCRIVRQDPRKLVQIDTPPGNRLLGKLVHVSTLLTNEASC